ncbi:ferrochelatase [Ornithinimicrobium ciconiae]|uniref:Coproporphyrin III ferrochelatase n=1 Tax=Ornithinimicrobium ciconiae TaxID=2594265 RepID=A0A516GAB1_9MICO|nr:ferrochelatase [Ornithinimicrobium ciconiae]QDO88466.1 ferrochelatase [Ornithinimicrobium ciconiae]
MSNPIADPADPGQETSGQEGADQRLSGAGAPAQESAYETESLAELERDVELDSTAETEPYDAVVLVSFGGPEAPEEVMPFLRRVTRGRGIPDDRLADVAEHYQAFGGKSPINDQNRALLAALGEEFARREISTPLLWGNRNSEPFLTDTLRGAAGEGMTRFLAVTTSAYSSYSSCRQYREDIAESIAELTEEGTPVRVDKIRQYWNHPGFASTNARLVTEAARQVRDRTGALPHLVYVTHSIPDAMDDTSGPGDGEGNVYSAQHQALSQAITEEARATLGQGLTGELTYCSRSGPPTQPWLEPDVNDRLRELAQEGVTHVVMAPIGFVSDHMEVIFDLDTEAQETAAEVGIEVLRVPTVGIDPQFVSGLADLVLERAAEARDETPQRPVWPAAEPWPSVCRPGCCPNLRVAKPAACGAD